MEYFAGTLDAGGCPRWGELLGRSLHAGLFPLVHSVARCGPVTVSAAGHRSALSLGQRRIALSAGTALSFLSGGIVLLRACVTVQPGRQQSQFEWNVWDTCHQFFYSSAAAFLLFSPERTPPMGVRCFSFFPDGQGIGGGFLGRLEFLHDVGTAAGVAKLCTHRGNCTRIFSLSHAMDHSRFLRRLPV